QEGTRPGRRGCVIPHLNSLGHLARPESKINIYIIYIKPHLVTQCSNVRLNRANDTQRLQDVVELM
ncbi:hypothetical protein, partial [Aeromonas salmonicida]|uniref:hypothetical protein n=1 Tax=Aeromonas salmonicida TaxID=645 RepID=UPI00366AFD00